MMVSCIGRIVSQSPLLAAHQALEKKRGTDCSAGHPPVATTQNRIYHQKFGAHQNAPVTRPVGQFFNMLEITWIAGTVLQPDDTVMI
jgi:hypothetical protein